MAFGDLFRSIQEAVSGASLDQYSFAPPAEPDPYVVPDINVYRGYPVDQLPLEVQALVPEGMTEVIYNVQTGNIIHPDEWARGIRD